MENLEVSVFDPRAVEVWGGERLSIEGSEILTIPLTLYSHKVSVFSNAMVRDKLSHLSVSFLIEEDDRVKVGLCAVILYPSFTRVIGILKVASEGGCKTNGPRWGSGPGNGRLILSESYWFVTIDTVVAHVWFCEV